MQKNKQIILGRDKLIRFWRYYALGTEGDINVMETNRFIPPTVLEQYTDRFNKSLVSRYRNHLLTNADIHDIESSRMSEPLTESGQEEWMKLETIITDPRFSPLLAETFERLPPAIIYAAEHDVLRDDSFLYAAQLRQFGIPVQFFHDKKGYHGSFWANCDEVGLTETLEKIFD